MNLAVISVAALALAVIVSCVSPLNVGVLAVALAWIVGVYIGGLPVNTVMGGFPSQLFLTLTGVTLLFALAQSNGTLERITRHAVGICRGNLGLIPVMFFVLGAALSSMGPGNIATAALVAPLAMSTAVRSKIPLFLMAIMIGNGANAGALSPFAPTGIIVNGLMARNQLPGLELQTYLYNLAAHALVAFSGYALFGGLKLFGQRDVTSDDPAHGRRRRGRRLHQAPLDHDRGDRHAHPQRHLRADQRRHGRVSRRGHSRPHAIGRRRRGDQADAVAGDRDGVRRDRAHLAGRTGAGHRSARAVWSRRSRPRRRSPSSWRC